MPNPYAGLDAPAIAAFEKALRSFGRTPQAQQNAQAQLLALRREKYQQALKRQQELQDQAARRRANNAPTFNLDNLRRWREPSPTAAAAPPTVAPKPAAPTPIENLRQIAHSAPPRIRAHIEAQLQAAGVPHFDDPNPTRATAYIVACGLHAIAELQPHIGPMLRWQAPVTPINLGEKHFEEFEQRLRQWGGNALRRAHSYARHAMVLRTEAWADFFHGVWPHLTAGQQRTLRQRLTAHARQNGGPSTAYMNGYTPDAPAIEIVVRFLLHPVEGESERAPRTIPHAEATPYILAASLWWCANESRYWYPPVYDPANWHYL